MAYCRSCPRLLRNLTLPAGSALSQSACIPDWAIFIWASPLTGMEEQSSGRSHRPGTRDQPTPWVRLLEECRGPGCHQQPHWLVLGHLESWLLLQKAQSPPPWWAQRGALEGAAPQICCLQPPEGGWGEGYAENSFPYRGALLRA